MAEHELPKLGVRVRFPSPAPIRDARCAMRDARCAMRNSQFAAVSRVGRDELVESFGWSIPSEGVAWPLVEACGDGVEVVLAVAAQVGGFGEVLAGGGGSGFLCAPP